MTVTQELARREEMLARRTTIGASDVAAIVGLDRFRDAGDVYDSVVASQDGTAVHGEPTGDQLRGILLESIAADLYCSREGVSMRRVGSRSHPTLALHANADREVLKGPNVEATHPCEIKVPRPQTFRGIVEHGANPSHVVQGQVQLSCFPGHPAVRLVWMEPVTMDTYGIMLPRRDNLIAGLEDAVHRFIRDHVEPRIRPVNFEVELPELPELGGEVEVWDDEETRKKVEAWGTVELIARLGKQAGELKKLASSHFAKAMGRTKVVEVPGLARLTHVVIQNGRVYDTKALDAHLGDEADKFKKDRKGSEYIRVTWDETALAALAPSAQSAVLGELAEPRRALEAGDEEV